MRRIKLFSWIVVFGIVFPLYSFAVTKQFQIDSGGNLTTALVSYYKLEDATDFWGSNNLTNNGSVTFVSGKVNNAANFIATSSQYLNIVLPTGLPLSNASGTMAVWLNASSLPGAGEWIGQLSYGQASTRVSRNIDITDSASGNKMEFGAYADDTVGTTTPSTGVWYFVVATYDGGTTGKIYVNGVLNASHTFGAALNTGLNAVGLAIGRDAANSLFFNGKVDEAAIWGRVLSDAEIAELYNGGAGQTMIISTPGGGAICHIKALGKCH